MTQHQRLTFSLQVPTVYEHGTTLALIGRQPDNPWLPKGNASTTDWQHSEEMLGRDDHKYRSEGWPTVQQMRVNCKPQWWHDRVEDLLVVQRSSTRCHDGRGFCQTG